MKISAISLIVALIILTSCKRQREFDRELWLRGGDVGIYPERESMVEDLTTNHQLKGLQVAELRGKLGEPNETDSAGQAMVYIVNTYYSSMDIDPRGSQILIFRFDKDSTIINYELQTNGGH